MSGRTFRETRNGCTGASYHWIDGRRVSNHDFSVAWLASLKDGHIGCEPDSDDGRVKLWNECPAA